MADSDTLKTETDAQDSSWGALIRGGNAARCAVVGGGMVMHAINVFIAVTILPSVVRDIGGLRYFAWSTTLYVVASLLGGANCASMLRRVGVRNLYRLALLTFAVGACLCATAPVMGVLLLGRFVQGLGAGTLSALSFSNIRLLFPQPLWSRAFSVISLAWGIATLGGPAIGGIFAEYGAWRLAFWCLAGLAPLMLVLVELSLPRSLAPSGKPLPVALLSLGVLAVSALCVSAGSMAQQAPVALLGLLAALVLLGVFMRREGQTAVRVLPRGACDPRTRLSGIYGAMLLMLIGVNAEIFVPYFLQKLHGMTPLHAGYTSAMMAGGWALISAVVAGRGAARLLLRLGPILLAGGLIVLCGVMPMTALPNAVAVPVMALALGAIGSGMGVCWPSLGTSVFTAAPEDERDLASASITTIIMVGNAFGSATAGMVTNIAGLADAPATAAIWLFGLFALAPLSALLVTRRLR